MPISPVPRYTPWLRGVYDVAPGLRFFGTDFGNGVADQQVFPIDCDWKKHRLNKLRGRAVRVGKYVQRGELSQDVENAAIDLIAQRFCMEHPELFQMAGAKIECKLTEEAVDLRTSSLGYIDVLDGLMSQVQEDLAIVRVQDDRDWLAYLHLFSPSHWAAEDKIGKSFAETHEPVPGFERAILVAKDLVKAMVEKAPLVRFVWGVESDDHLNHHPAPDPGFDSREWGGRLFDVGRFWVRTERQVIWGLPQVNAALFMIRVGFVPDREIMKDQQLREPLVRALNSMSPKARVYKGLSERFDALLDLLGN